MRPLPVTLRQLQYVLAVAEHRSFGLAARACRVSQPALSAQVAQAEQALGLRLFERNRRGVRLTAAGEALLPRAKELLAQADELAAAAERLGDPLSGRLRLGLIPTVAPYLLPLVAPALREAFPGLQLAWIEDKTAALLERLGKGELDGAVVALDAAVSRLPHVVLGEDPFVLAVAPDHALASGSGTVSAEALSGQTVLLLDDGHCFRDQALSACARAGAVESGYRATSLSTLVQMAAGGLGITLLPRVAVEVENRRSALHVRDFDSPGPQRTLVLAYRVRAGLERTMEPVAEVMARAWKG
jgi:LysR family hydrogen peroxide-inducible transcriptional activator